MVEALYQQVIDPKKSCLLAKWKGKDATNPYLVIDEAAQDDRDCVVFSDIDDLKAHLHHLPGNASRLTVIATRKSNSRGKASTTITLKSGCFVAETETAAKVRELLKNQEALINV